MKISKLSINNMYGTRSLTFSPGKLNVLLAHNGAGKTTVFKAIQYLLTGNVRGENFIKEGSAEASVSGEIEGNSVSRSKVRGSTNKLKINGKATTQKSFDEMLATMGYLPSAIKLLTASEVISSSAPSDFTNFFVQSKMLPIEADADKIVELCAPLSPEAESEMRAVFVAAPGKNTLEDIDLAYKSYMDIAKETKGRLQIIKAQADKITEIEEPKFTESQLDDELRDLESNNPSALLAYNSAVNRKNELSKLINDISEQIEANKSERPMTSKITQLQADREGIFKSLQENNKLAAVLSSNIKQSEEIIENLSKKVCPIHADITCNTDKTSVEEKLRKTLAETKAELERVQTVIADLTSSLEKTDQKIAEYSENEKNYNAKVELIKRKNAYQESLAAIVVPAKPVSTCNPAELDSKRRIIQMKRKQLTLWNEAQAAAKEAEKVEKTLAVYKEVADKLSGKEGGIKDKIIELALEPLICAINSTAASLKVDFKMRAITESGVHFYCQTSSSSGFQKYDDLSNGEKVVAEILVMDMLNQLTGTNILILDNLDSLDKTTFGNVLSLLQSPVFATRYDHIFVAAVDHDDLEEIVSGKSGITRIM